MSPPLVRARGLVKRFARRSLWGGRRGEVRAVDGVDLDVAGGETLGLVGESGSGKSTLGRMLIRLIEPDAGTIELDGRDLLALAPRELRRARRRFQMVFQDPFGSLNPRMRVGDAIGEPLYVHGLEPTRSARRERVAALLREVGLGPATSDRYPHELSGGQRQRVGIARAIACGPAFVVADEPVSALDPPVQAQIVNLMLELQARHGLSWLFIAHDLRLVERICDRVAVMYLGRIVEQAPAAALYRTPRHPYTQALLASTPGLEPGRATPPAIEGEPASPADRPTGCAFHPRCPVAVERCERDEPPLLAIGGGHSVACHLVAAASGETDRASGA